MTVGVLTTSFPRHAGDFAGCFVEDAARACAAAGESVEVIAAGDTGWKGSTPESPLDLPSTIEVFRVSTGGDVVGERGRAPLFFGDGAPETLERNFIGGWIQAGLFWAALCERIRARAPRWDRIVAHWLVPCALAARAVAPRLPLTAYAHSGDVALLERMLGGAEIARKLAREVDDLVFVSESLQARFCRLSGLVVGRVANLARATSSVPLTGAFATAHHPTALAGVAPAADAHRPLILLSVGRLVPIKGFDVLLRAVAAMRADANAASSAPGSVRVVILGDGPERVRLQELARRLRLDLHLPGFVPRTDVARWMTAAHLYVQPSRALANGRTEGMPVATLEAIDAGLPVIVSATGGLNELPDAAKVPAENVTALALSLQQFCSLPLSPLSLGSPPFPLRSASET